MEKNLTTRSFQSVVSIYTVVMLVFALLPFGLSGSVSTAKAASRASNWLQNGSFENLTGGVPDNWTVVGTVIDLGVTSLGGCVSVDTTDYSTYAGSPTADVTNGTHSSYTASIVNSGGFGVPTEGSNAMYLNLGGGNADPGYHVKHGPAIVSDAFKGVAGQVITLNWYSAAGSDDFAVLGYLLDTDANGDGVASGAAGDCAQTEVLDTHGKTVVGWQYAAVTVPNTRDFYKFVFVNGTHDFSGGRASGASFWIDNISQGDPQTISFDLTGTTANYGTGWVTAPFSIASTATATSTLPVTFASLTTSKCTVTSSGTVTIVGAGTCTIAASQAGGETGGVLWAAAPIVTQSFTIGNVAATAQTITFATPADVAATADPYALTATSTSGMAVTFTSSTASVCTVTSSGTVTLVAPGTCTIVAAQAGGVVGGTTYAPAPNITRSFPVTDVQTITFGELSDKDPTAANFSVSATSSSGLAVTFTSATPAVCTVTSGGTVDVLAAGICEIVAAQVGGTTGGIKYTAATPVSQSFTVRTGQIITFTAPSPVDQDAADFTLGATSDSGLAVTYTSNSPSVCTVTSDGTVTMVSYGTCSITAAQSGGTNAGTDYAAATSVTRTFVSRKLQAITFAALSDKNPTAADFSVSATSDSGLTVTYSTTTTGVCTVTSSGTVSIVAPGTCTIDADQAGGLSSGTTYAVAPTVSQSFTVRTPQTITFAAPSPVDQDAAAFTLTGTSDSGLAVTYTSSTTGVCTVTSDGTVTMVSFGTCTITAAQAGGENSGTKYAPATTVTRSFTSRKLQTITFTVLSDKSIFEPPFSLSATASSTLPVTYTSSTTSVCTVTSGGTVTLVTTGTCTITAAQAGGVSDGVTYAVAPTVSQTFSVLTIQTITFNQPADRPSTSPAFAIGATASSGLPVTYVSTTPAVCTVTSSGTVTLVTFGSCTIKASQAGGTKDGTLYEAANDVSRTFVSLRNQSVTFPALTDKVYTAANYSVTATASSTLPVSFTSTTPTICTVTSSGTVDLLLPGTCTLSAVAAAGTAGGVAYAESPAATQSFTVNAVAQAITFPVPPESHLYQVGSVMAATASSSLGVTYTSMTPDVCTIVGKNVSFIAIGKCSIKASQTGGTAGGTIYAAATEITRDFFVTNYTATFTVTPTNTRTFTPTLTPTPIPFLLKKGAVGASFVLGLLQNNTLVTWGMNREYQANIPPCCGSNIQDIAVGTNFALALKGGKVYGWGANTKGQLKFPKTTNAGITEVAAGGAHGLALTSKGKVIAWGDNNFKQAQVPALKKVVKSVVGGANHTVVLYTDGTVAAWGSNANKQSSPPTTLKGIVQIAAGLDHNLALKSDGTVASWGGNAFGQAAIPPNAIDIKQVSAGTQFSMAVKNNGQVIAWGRNDFNQTFIPTEYTDIYSAFAGYSNTILGLRSGRVVVLGDQSNGVDASRTPTNTATPTP